MTGIHLEPHLSTQTVHQSTSTLIWTAIFAQSTDQLKFKHLKAKIYRGKTSNCHSPGTYLKLKWMFRVNNRLRKLKSKTAIQIKKRPGQPCSFNLFPKRVWSLRVSNRQKATHVNYVAKFFFNTDNLEVTCRKLIKELAKGLSYVS